MQDQIPTKKSRIILLNAIVLTLICVVVAAAAGYFILQKNQADISISETTNQTEASGRQKRQPASPPTVEQTAGPIEYDKDELVYSGDAPVYVTFYSHNEDTWAGQVGNKARYAEYRDGLLDRVNLLAEYGIVWDWQTDQSVVEAMIEYEDDPDIVVTTDGKNILEYMIEHGVSLDPHAHTNNYADIVYLIEQLGVKASTVIGGLRYIDCGKEYLDLLDFMSWHEQISLTDDGYIYGKDFPSAKWQPTILSCPSMGGHWFDEGSSGIWRPGDENDFYSDFSDNKIIYVGSGLPSDSTIIGEHHSSGAKVIGTDGAFIKELVKKIADKELPTGTESGEKFIYTASIHFRDTAIVTDDEEETITLDGLRQVLEELKQLEESGQIIFANFEEVAKIWQDDYDSVPWRADLSSFSFYDEEIEQVKSYCEK